MNSFVISFIIIVFISGIVLGWYACKHDNVGDAIFTIATGSFFGSIFYSMILWYIINYTTIGG